ncbi:MAG: protein kinase [Alphaproteobacteria bacterium]|jgi:serine/threonine-protein kinase|nr:protein kinase [Alphaproteobacteria bacterium]
MTEQRIGKYRLDRVLGRGAMGVVYRAVDTTIDRVVALKTVRAELLQGEDYGSWLERFHREACAAARCHHPNIVTIFEFGEADDTHFISMEFVDGVQLSDYLFYRPRIDVAAGAVIVEQVLAALAFAHERGIVHRDIKPENIMLLEDGGVKVTDFGVARLDSTSLTQQGEMIGTPSYMAPEQFSGGSVDNRTDLFAVGVVLFELVTGTRPFQARGLPDLMHAVISGPQPDPTRHKAGLPPGLVAVIRQALARAPEERFATAADFAAALRRALETAALQPAAPTGLQFDDDVLARTERHLAAYVGPLARVLVRQAAMVPGSRVQLYDRLAPHIADEQDRHAFRRKALEPPAEGDPGQPPRRGGHRRIARRRPRAGAAMVPAASRADMAGGTTMDGAVLDKAAIDQAVRDLTEYLGPLARITVRRTAATADSIEALYRSLSEEIPDARQRAAFLKRLPAA